MQIITDRSYHTDAGVVVLGMFDGVHIGHRVLIQKGRALANEAKVPLIVSTFAQHPLSLIAPEKAPKILTTNEEKAEVMEKLGVDVLLMQDFTPEMMNTDPADYIGLLVQRFHPCDVVCGYNHHFGRKGEGAPALLEAVGLALGFRTHVVPQIRLNGEEVSSTAIRKALEAGHVSAANKLLGRAYALPGHTEGNAEGHFFLYKDDRKVMLPPQSYRALLKTNAECIPVTTIADENHRMKLYGRLIPEGECRLELLR